MNYTQFKDSLIGLESWNPNHAILMKDLSLKVKPAHLSFCQRMILSITHSRAKNAVGAAEALQKLSIKYKSQLYTDEETLNRLIKVNAKINTTFLKQHKLSSSKRRDRIQAVFLKIQGQCVNLQKKHTSKNAPKIKHPKKAKKNPSIHNKKDAIHFFNKMAKKASTLSEEEANQLLIKAKQIREKLGKDDPGLRDAHFGLRLAIRGAIFAERLEQNQNDLDALKANLAGKSDSKVKKILKKWQKSLSKNKPIGIPKWFHCTNIKGINSILTSGTIEVRCQTGWPGAFASTFPEESYGEYCIAMSSQIETNGQSQTPLITYVGRVGKEKIYVGERPAPRGKKDALKFKKDAERIPVIWSGFRKNITLEKPNKSNDPIGYYANTNFLLIGKTDYQKNDQWLSGIEPKVQKKLARKKIDILYQPEFYELLDLITQTFHCHVPYSWAEAEAKGFGTLSDVSFVSIAED